jgi:hypothetical protein
MADTPLIDTGKMARGISINVSALPHSVIVSAPFPAEVHEQDPEMAVISPGIHTPPMRKFLGPALEESIDPITAELEAWAAPRLTRGF